MQQKIGIEIGNYGAQGGHYINLGGEVSKAFEVEKKPPEWKGNEGGLIAKLIIESPFSDDYKKGDISMGMYQDGEMKDAQKFLKDNISTGNQSLEIMVFRSSVFDGEELSNDSSEGEAGAKMFNLAGQTIRELRSQKGDFHDGINGEPAIIEYKQNKIVRAVRYNNKGSGMEQNRNEIEKYQKSLDNPDTVKKVKTAVKSTFNI